MAVLKSMPLAAEVKQSGLSDAGEWVLNLKATDINHYRAFLEDETKHAQWGEEPRGGPLHERLEGLITLIIRIIEGYVTHALGNLEVSEDEMRKFVRRNDSAFSAAKKSI